MNFLLKLNMFKFVFLLVFILLLFKVKVLVLCLVVFKRVILVNFNNGMLWESKNVFNLFKRFSEMLEFKLLVVMFMFKLVFLVFFKFNVFLFNKWLEKGYVIKKVFLI